MSNLLDKASILLTPTAYNDGSMLSVKPENGDGDFDFTRGSAATRFNAQGLVENVQILSPELVSNGNFSQIGTEEVSNGNFSQEGSELITNGDFATGSNWTLSSGITYNSSGYIDFDGTQGAGQARNTPNITFVQGKTYKVVFEIKNYVSGSIKFRFQNGVNTIGQPQNGDGVKTEYIVCNDSSNNNFQFFNSVDFIGSIDNVSVKEVGQDWLLYTGWSIGEDKVEADGTSAFLIQGEFQSVASVKSYKIQYEVISTNGVNIRFGGGSSMFGTPTLDTSTIGIKTIYLTSNGTVKNLQFQNNLGFIGSITNISVKEVGQDWTFGTGWSVDQANSRAEATDAPFGSQLIDATTLVASKKYSISFDISNYIKGIVRVAVGNVFSNEVSGDGSYTFILTSANTNAFKVQARGGAGGTTLSVSNISVKEITDDTDLPRINYEGFSYQDSLGSEEVVNGDFATDSNWNKDANWSIANGVATSTGVGRMFQSIPFLETNVGTKVKVSFDITNNSNGGVVVNCYGGISQLFTGVGTHTFTTTTTDSSNLYFNNSGAGANFIGSIDNVSVKEYLGQEVVPDSGCGSWLLEGQSTNYSINSEQPSTWHSSGGVTITANAATSPEGLQNSSLVVNNVSSGTRYSRNSFVFPSGSGLHTVTTSYFIKYYNNQWVRLRSIYFDGSPANNASTYFDIQNGVIGTVNANHTAKIKDYGNGWYRCSITFNIDKSVGYGGYVHVEPMDSDNSGTFAAIGQGFYAYGSQGEESSYPTSYIPTGGAIATRLQDIATNSGNSTLINSTEGVLYAEIAALANYNLQRWISLSDGTHNNTIKIGILNSGIHYKIACEVRSGGVSQVFLAYNFGAVEPTFVKVAIKYKENDFALWINGVEVYTDTSGSVPIGLSELNFDRGNGGLKFEGKAKALAVYKEALTDAQLQSLTTI